MDNSMERQMDYAEYEIMQALDKVIQELVAVKKELRDIKETLNREGNDGK